MRVVSYIGAFVAFIVPANSVARCGQPHDCNPTTITDREICDFHKVDNDLYRGARPTCSGLAKLRALGIRTFIDLGGAEAAVHDCEAETKKAGMHIIPYKINVIQIVATGVSDANLRQLFALMQRSPKPIFVGCSLGRDRTGTIVALYRMRRGEMSFSEALQEAQYYGYRRSFRGLRKALERYEDSQELRLLPLPSLTPVPAGSVCRPASVGSDHEVEKNG